MRQVLLPALPDRVLVLPASRPPPSDPWTEAPACRGLFHAMPLGLPSDGAVAELLARLDVHAQFFQDFHPAVPRL